ncbi:MAG: triose-phosphate isomerase [Candidatus Accumulibacter sp.]|uniref:triose-phosphate isomerase n=1 Tax=Accumulibacter sp. TaxID=2053492 RepID=UPI00287AFD47|nr:triose-phosphate isomerase [Accumulibacter sp.]MDS4014464.1 triose-phosphate isomerase [Accumulibacter sp.]HMW63803.1 triose-phosphate isomerase [Accumulibacter sp.]HMW80169.1 triose-phosphate isomerase [Accumulibacter sp.]HNG87100.1 triose-phosphate isomerase [Accumulibacter sp.]HNL97164.1 triose-phosphate isomerase [Accumulibacter sp.]
MRKIVIAGNWKMNKTVAESVRLASEVAAAARDVQNVVVVVAPTYLALAKVADVLQGTKVKLAAQDVHWENQGAYTGKVSADMLKEIGVEYVIIGHSEQRTYFGETDDTVNKKVKKVLALGMSPIICIGETLAERQGGRLESVLTTQVNGAYEGLSIDDARRTVIAYEPVWAIGTGVTATDDEAQQAHAFVRSLLAKLYGDELAQSISIQYGGSMKPENAAGLLAQKDIDGGLIGGAALKADSFLGIVTPGDTLSK